MLKVKSVAFLRIYPSFSPALCDSFCTHTCIFISHEINMNLHILLVCMCVWGGGGGVQDFLLFNDNNDEHF